MSKFSENIKEKESKVQDYKTSKKELGKYFYDLSKATYVAMVIGGILGIATSGEESLSQYLAVAAIGIVLTYCFAKLGNMCHTFNNK